MSVATAMNLAIALTEGRPDVVRGITRSLALNEVNGLNAVTGRLLRALERREQTARCSLLLEILDMSMIIEPPSDWPPERVQAYLEGISFMEQVIDDKLTTARAALGIGKDDEQ